MPTTSWKTCSMYRGWPGTRLGQAQGWPGLFPGHPLWFWVVLFLFWEYVSACYVPLPYLFSLLCSSRMVPILSFNLKRMLFTLRCGTLGAQETNFLSSIFTQSNATASAGWLGKPKSWNHSPQAKSTPNKKIILPKMAVNPKLQFLSSVT